MNLGHLPFLRRLKQWVKSTRVYLSWDQIECLPNLRTESFPNSGSISELIIVAVAFLLNSADRLLPLLHNCKSSMLVPYNRENVIMKSHNGVQRETCIRDKKIRLLRFLIKTGMRIGQYQGTSAKIASFVVKTEFRDKFFSFTKYFTV